MREIVERADDRLDTFVREHIIRGQDPRDPQASQNGIKTRTYVLVLAAVLVPAAVFTLVPVPAPVAGAFIGPFAFGVMRSVATTINEAGDEWTRREERIRARAIPEREGPDA